MYPQIVWTESNVFRSFIALAGAKVRCASYYGFNWDKNIGTRAGVVQAYL